jgi:hypothetical protein
MKAEKKAGACPTCGGMCPECGSAMEKEDEGTEQAQEKADLKTMLNKEISRRFAKKGK